jgi:hypothetical protein
MTNVMIYLAEYLGIRSLKHSSIDVRYFLSKVGNACSEGARKKLITSGASIAIASGETIMPSSG